MRMFVALILGIMFSLQAGFVVAQSNPFSLEIDIYLDENADSLYQEAEPRLADWPIQVFDSSFNLIVSSLSVADATSVVDVTEEPAYVCVGPASGYIQTVPLIGTQHPDDPNWTCHDVVEVYTFQFLIAEEPTEPEELPGIIEEINTEPVEKDPVEEPQGEVLGETTPEVLAETGAETWLPMTIGTILILSILVLAPSRRIN